MIAFNEFTNDVVKLKDTPWGTPAGVWDEVDELEMGNWLTRQHWLPSMPRGTLEEAVAMVAKRHRFHPVREQLEALRGKWDGTKRLGTWLRPGMGAPGSDAGLRFTGKWVLRLGIILMGLKVQTAFFGAAMAAPAATPTAAPVATAAAVPAPEEELADDEELPVLIEMPPLSKQMPLPTRATRPLALAGV